MLSLTPFVSGQVSKQNTIVLSDPGSNSLGSRTLTLVLATAWSDIAYIRSTVPRRGREMLRQNTWNIIMQLTQLHLYVDRQQGKNLSLRLRLAQHSINSQLKGLGQNST